jgi:hypothetical protein
MKKLILFVGLIVFSGCIVSVTGCGNSGDTGVTKEDIAKGNKELPPDDGNGPGTVGGAAPPPDAGSGGPKKGK